MTTMLNELSNFIFTSKYARYNEKLKRRETWTEAVDRVESMHLKKFSNLSKEDVSEIKWAFDLVRNKRVVPSMRSMQFGGKAVEAHNARLFNCAVRHIDSIRSFSEVFYLLLCGCGVGLGLSKFFLNRLPDLVDANDKTGTVITYAIEDTIEGWSDSLEALLNCYFKNTAYTGRKIVFDYSKIRKKGTPLRTGGGYAPGYKPLKAAHIRIKFLLDYIIETANQTRLKPINAYDILMFCGDATLSGGVRRTATSVIFDKDEDDLINAKINFKVTKYAHFEKNDKTNKWEGVVYVDGHFGGYKNHKYEVALTDWEHNFLKDKKEIAWQHIEPQRGRSNNSILLLRDKLAKGEFDSIFERTKLWGEPGFVFGNHPWQLFNPCFEVGFIPVTEDGVCGVQFCNLTSQNGNMIDSREKFKENVKAQTIIGTLQASYTDFPYLSKTAKFLTDSEALLGNSITSMMANADILLNPETQKAMAEYAVEINEAWAKKLGINPAARINVIKPEGTGTLALGSVLAGIHGAHAHKMFRLVQTNKDDPIYKWFKKHNPHMCEESVWSANKTDDVIYFPLNIDKKAITRDDLTALKHLEYVKSTQLNWILPASKHNKKPITHNVSCTITVKDDEWNEVSNYLYNNRQYFGAVSLLSYIGDTQYEQAPNQKVADATKEERFNYFLSHYKPVDYTLLKEEEDMTNVVQESSCAGGLCTL